MDALTQITLNILDTMQQSPGGEYTAPIAAFCILGIAGLLAAAVFRHGWPGGSK